MTTTDDAPDPFGDLAELMQADTPAARADAPDDVDPSVRRTRRRRRMIIVAAVLAVILALTGGYANWALTTPVPTPAEMTTPPTPPRPEAAAIALPPVGASAISIEGAEDYLGPAASGIWAAAGTDDPRPMASITKLITALVVLDAVPLTDAAAQGPTLTFDRADHALYDKYYSMGATIAAMPTGSSLSLRDALATMLIPSACNYAEAITDWAFGSQGAFIGAAKRWLAANGLARTTIVEATGIDARNTSTPSDMLTLGRLAAANPAVAQIVATPALTLPGPGPIRNTNDLLGIEGITGMKTGTLDDVGANLLYTASLDVGTGAPLAVTGIVLGGHSKETVDASVLRLLDSIRNGFSTVDLAAAGDTVGSYSTPWGGSAQLVLSEDASIFVWSDTPIAATMETTTPMTWSDGEIVGSVTWTAGPKTVTVPIEIRGRISPPSAWWRLTHPGDLGS